MRFVCIKCNKEINIYKVKFTSIDNKLVCKDAYCCSQYMDQVLTDEYKGMPDIHRDADDTQHSNPMREWDKFKSDNAEKP
jgi:hypothetical protein|tara:strand:+ start:1077 stop:1316 length:240 start_codon:yes stop_codon:yes gene_type:complete